MATDQNLLVVVSREELEIIRQRKDFVMDAFIESFWITLLEISTSAATDQ
jgi:hypothetical protein